jgi:DinB superfamily
MHDLAALIDQLERFAAVLPPVARCAGEDGARWKPDEEHWSILEIVNHMADEEIEDFRTRAFSTLRDPSEPWPVNDPERTVRERDHQHKDLEASIERFVEARQESIRMLRELSEPAWSNAHEHPKIGSLRAGDVFASWVAHDALHLRQIGKRLYQLTCRHSEPFSADYAGAWDNS